MAITRVYAPRLSGLVDIAQGAGAADQQLQYDQLRQRERLARMQFASQRLGAQEDLQRMQFGAGLQQQRDMQGAAIDAQRQQRGFDFAGQQAQQDQAARQAMMGQNQAFQSQQAEEAFLRNQQADLAAAAQRQGLMETQAALNHTYDSLNRNEQQIDEFNKTIAPRLNAQGQRRHSKLMHDLEAVDQAYDNGSGNGTLTARQWAASKAKLQDAFLAEKWDKDVMENGSMPGDVVIKSGVEYVVQEDGISQKPTKMVNELEHAEATGIVSRAPDGTVQSIDYTNPLTNGSRSWVNPKYTEYLEAQKQAAAEYKEEAKEYRRQASVWDMKLADLMAPSNLNANGLAREAAIKLLPPRPVPPTLNVPQPFGSLPTPTPEQNAAALVNGLGSMAGEALGMPAPMQEQPPAAEAPGDAELEQFHSELGNALGGRSLDEAAVTVADYDAYDRAYDSAKTDVERDVAMTGRQEAIYALMKQTNSPAAKEALAAWKVYASGNSTPEEDDAYYSAIDKFLKEARGAATQQTQGEGGAGLSPEEAASWAAQMQSGGANGAGLVSDMKAEGEFSKAFPGANPEVLASMVNEMPRPQSEEEYNTIPAGTLYVNADGEIRRKK
jgi:hypothetical protein